MRTAVLFTVVCLLPLVLGHGILYDPEPRLGLDRPGTESKKYTHSSYGTSGSYPLRTSVIQACGDDPEGTAQGVVTKVFTPGTGVGVEWELTLPHPRGTQQENIGIYLRDDSGTWTTLFYEDETDDDDPSGSGTLTTGDTKTAGVLLDSDLTCNECVLAWVWDSEADGGGYIDCADIAVREDYEIHLTITASSEADLNSNLIKNSLVALFSTWDTNAVTVTVTETSTNRFSIEIVLSDYDSVPADQLLAQFNSYMESDSLKATVEDALGTDVTILSTSDDGATPGGGDDNPFLGAASSLSASMPALILAAAALVTLLRL